MLWGLGTAPRRQWGFWGLIPAAGWALHPSHLQLLSFSTGQVITPPWAARMRMAEAMRWRTVPTYQCPALPTRWRCLVRHQQPPGTALPRHRPQLPGALTPLTMLVQENVRNQMEQPLSGRFGQQARVISLAFT